MLFWSLKTQSCKPTLQLQHELHHRRPSIFAVQVDSPLRLMVTTYVHAALAASTGFRPTEVLPTSLMEYLSSATCLCRAG